MNMKDKPMKLHWSPRSPFVRKVMITLAETGQTDQVELSRNVVALHMPPNPAVLADNPLGKIPALRLEDGTTLFDSRVICEYLDTRANAGLLPAEPTTRLMHLRWQAFSDGLTDNLLLWRTELTRPTGPWEAVTNGWRIKTRAAMAQLEVEAPMFKQTPFGLGHIALACALGQLDFRWSDCNWRDHFPQLAEVAKELNARPSVKDTAIVDDQASDSADPTAGQLTF